MRNENSILNPLETEEILEAACSALEFAFEYAQALRHIDERAARVPAFLVKALQVCRAAESGDTLLEDVPGQMANALAHLREALQVLQELGDSNELLGSTMRSTARALSLLYPLTLNGEPHPPVPRKKGKPSRRKAPVVAGGGDRETPQFQVEVGRDTDTNFYAGFEGNIASGGLFIATYDVQPLGASVSVKAALPGGEVVEEQATVEWTREYNESCPDAMPGMGVVFHRLSPSGRQLVDAFMEEREAIFFEAV